MKFKSSLILLLLAFQSLTFANEAHYEAPKAEEVKHEAVAADAHTASAHNLVNEHAEHKREAGPVKPDQALKWLQNGNKRFMNGTVRRDGATKKDRERLSTGQKPHTIVLSCSDSRVPPELIFDQKLGEIFIIRTAGQSLDFAGIASIEYAVSHLGTNLILVMGHESCGAVKAALGTLKGGDAGSIWLNQLVKDLHPRLKRFTDLTPTDGVLVESWVNVEGTEKELLEKSEIVRGLVESGEVKIQKALFHLGTGEVEWR
jgi:carbonic anhydrase